MKPVELNRLFDFLSLQGLILLPRQREMVEKYYHLLVEWSSKMNLVSRGDLDHLLERHFLTSFYYADVIRNIGIHDETKIMDIGSGAGFPGVILSVVFENSIPVLIDSSRKKTFFLQRIKKELHLNAEIICDRIENLDERFDSRFDIITARAVSSLHNLIEWSQPRLTVCGKLVTIKGSQYINELGPYRSIKEELVVSKVDPPWIEYSKYLAGKLVIIMEKVNG